MRGGGGGREISEEVSTRKRGRKKGRYSARGKEKGTREDPLFPRGERGASMGGR